MTANSMRISDWSSDVFASDLPASLKKESALDHTPLSIDVERYYSREFHDLEVEKLWRRVWQLACHEDEIPEVGDALVYDIASLSFIVVKTGEDEFSAYPNACRHRGRRLLDCPKKGLTNFRCPFHGWSWKLDGTRSEEHTSELQSLMRISYAVFCLKKKKDTKN